MSNKRIYLYSDGIYVNHKSNHFSYLEKVYDAPLSNVKELRDYLESGTPADYFSMGQLDSEEYKDHIVPWKYLKQMLNLSFTIFQTYDQPHNTLHLFLFQKIHSNGPDEFKIVIPNQILNQDDLSLINNDKQLQNKLNDDEWIYNGQFIFINGNKNNDFDYSLDDNIGSKIALADIPQNLYLFNNISKQFNFRNCFAGMRVLPLQFSNNNEINYKFLLPKDVKNYLEVPIVKEENTDSTSLNNTFADDFAKQTTLQYYKDDFLFKRIPEEELGSILNKLSVATSNEKWTKQAPQSSLINDNIPVNDFASAKEETTAEPIVEKQSTKPIIEEKQEKPIVKEKQVKPIVEEEQIKPIVEEEQVKPIVEEEQVKPIAEEEQVKPIAEKTKSAKKEISALTDDALEATKEHLTIPVEDKQPETAKPIKSSALSVLSDEDDVEETQNTKSVSVLEDKEDDTVLNNAVGAKYSKAEDPKPKKEIKEKKKDSLSPNIQALMDGEE